VVVANVGSVERGRHHAGVAAGDVEEAEGLGESLVEGPPQDRADLALGQAITVDQFPVGPPFVAETALALQRPEGRRRAEIHEYER